ncbi:membrane dipeptidase [Streptomyces bikiniensis]|uniref:membrane dipeptidase n=1 Tax=Streptomyces bikiniensis TaxID=1896 RepID=UPI0004C2120D
MTDDQDRERRIAALWERIDAYEPAGFRARVAGLAAERPDGDAAALFEQGAVHAGSYGTTVDTPHTIGLEGASCYPDLIAELLHRDWSEADIAALNWGNAARVVRETKAP